MRLFSLSSWFHAHVFALWAHHSAKVLPVLSLKYSSIVRRILGYFTEKDWRMVIVLISQSYFMPLSFMVLSHYLTYFIPLCE